MAPHATADESTRDRSRTRVVSKKTISKHDEALIWERNYAVPAASDDLVQDLIAQSVQKSPKAPAVCAWDGELDYHELDDLSSRLSAVLLAKGIAKDVIVPLCFEKSAWTMIAMLAVMKTGGAFVLLNAEQPAGRLSQIVSQTRANLLLCSPAQESLASKFGPEVLAISPAYLFRLPKSPDAISTATNANPDDTIFIVFTSGSTGLPKGVVSSHRSFVSGFKHRRSILDMPNPRVFDFAAYSFDVSTDIILSTLILRGCVCVPSDAERQNDIAGAMRRLRVNSADLTPSVARLIKPQSVPDLKVLKLGGEPSTASDVEMWVPHAKLVNIYGPSECLVVATNDFKIGADPHTIGRGRGAVTWIVDPDDHNLLVPVGDVGELVVEGPIITKGYLHDPEKTAVSFIESPRWLLAGGAGHPGRQNRLYKTGDLVRYNTDGTIKYIGRKDTQVKIRGQRVELGEVQHQISQQIFLKTTLRLNPSVDLITPAGEHGRPTLMAFLGLSTFLQSQGHMSMPDQQTAYSALWSVTRDINRALLKVLPQYMVPSVYVPLWSLPLNNSGKTDRQQLRKLGEALTRRDLVALRAPPPPAVAATTTTTTAKDVSEKAKAAGEVAVNEKLTPTQTRLRQLWARLLGMDAAEIATDDHFLRLGGDSLLVMKLATTADDHGFVLTVQDIFTHPVLSDMAALVDRRKAT